jgi:hypothetical protein
MNSPATRRDVAIGAVRKEEAQGEGGRKEEAASADEEVGGEHASVSM